MPGRIGFAAYGPALARLPATAAEIAEVTGLRNASASNLMRSLWALRIVHPGGVTGNAETVKGGKCATVWHMGEGPAVSRRVGKARPYAQHIVFASIVRALEQPMTARELAEATGLGICSAQSRIRQLRLCGLLHIAEWTRDAKNSPAARYEWGRGVDAPKPKPLTDLQRFYARKARAASNALHRAWAANDARQAA